MSNPSTSVSTGQPGKRGFTKPPMLGVNATVARSVLVILTAMGWVSVTYGRINIALVITPPILVALTVFVTIYHVAITHWATTWWRWRHRRGASVMVPVPPAADVVVGGIPIGVVSENEHLVTMIELFSDPLAPTVVTDADERTVNVLSVADLSAFATKVLDVAVDSVDLLSIGFRAAGGFADMYQQITGPTVAPAERRSWIVVRIGMYDNLAAIDRRGGDGQAAEKTAAATCLRIADALARAGTDARPASADAIDTVNEMLHADAPRADHWSYLESLSSYTGVYYADPAHIAEDAPQWWTWPQSKAVASLVRLTPGPAGAVNIGALVRYRTEAQPSSPPVSRLGPLYGQQAPMWRQFRVGYLPSETTLPVGPLGSADPVLPFGPAGPLVGSIGDPRDHTSVHLPLAGSITVLCESALLLRQVALRTSTTGRPIVVISDEPDKWKPIVSLAVSGALLTDFPAAWSTTDDDEDDDPSSELESVDQQKDVFGLAGLDPEAVLVIDTDKDWPDNLPEVTILTDDVSCDADIELVDTDEQLGFTLRTSTGLTAAVRSPAAHEERRILALAPPPATARPARPAPVAKKVPAPTAAGRPIQQPPVGSAPRAPFGPPPPRAGRPGAIAVPSRSDGAGAARPGQAWQPQLAHQRLPGRNDPAETRPAGPPPRPVPGTPQPPAAPPAWRQGPVDVASSGTPPTRPPFPDVRRPLPPPPDPRLAQPPAPPQGSPKPAGGQRDWSAAFGRRLNQSAATKPAGAPAEPANGRHRAADPAPEPTRVNGSGKQDQSRGDDHQDGPDRPEIPINRPEEH